MDDKRRFLFILAAIIVVAVKEKDSFSNELEAVIPYACQQRQNLRKNWLSYFWVYKR